MKDKCEICGSTKNLTTIAVKPTMWADILSSCVCEECKKKYHVPYMKLFYAGETVAQNLVREYNSRHSNKPWIDSSSKKKEAPTMQVSYSGFTGELCRLELVAGSYDLKVYDSDKDVTYTFEGIDLEKMKFLGGAVSFGG